MYTLDANQARAADQRSSIITETGKYLGTFPRAEAITASSGTEGIDFSFKANDGRTCRFALYTRKQDGTVIKIGTGLVMAMLTCLQVRQMDAKPAKVRKWDMDANAEIDATVPCFTEIMNKPIGLLLEAEEYERNAGGIGKRMVLAGVFQAGTELTASEILDRKTTPAQLAKIVATLRDRPLNKGRSSSAPARAASGGDMGHAGMDIPDDDIPF